MNTQVLAHIQLASSFLWSTPPQVEKAIEELKEVEKKLAHRNKLILITDSSEEGNGVLESLRQRLSQKSKELLMTTQILLKFFQSLNGSLVDKRFMAMALLAYTGFLRFDEPSNLRLKDIIPHPTYFELFIESRKTDQPLYQLLKPVMTSVPGLTLSNICPKLCSFSLHLFMVAMTSCLGIYRLNPEPNLIHDFTHQMSWDFVKKVSWLRPRSCIFFLAEL